MASPLPTPSSITYQAVITVLPSSSIDATKTGLGFIAFSGIQSTVTWSVLSQITAAATPQAVTIKAGVQQPATITALGGQATFWFPLVVQASTVSWTSDIFPTLTLTPLNLPTALSGTSSGTSLTASSTSLSTLLSTSSALTSLGQTSASLTSTVIVSGTKSTVTSGSIPTSSTLIAPKKTYSTGALAGIAVGCALAGILLSSILFLFLYKRRNRRHENQPTPLEKWQPLLPGHGEAVYVAGSHDTGWEKHLPQADSDSTIQASTSRTLDQIAMHVENFYTSRRNVELSTEHQFELEIIGSSNLSVPAPAAIKQYRDTNDMIKHYISSYILSMISFDGGSADGMFLPKSFRRQQHPMTQNNQALSQAYSRWRVLTVYLRQEIGDDDSYIKERNAIIDTAARHVCKAFEPWAKVDEDVRFQNMVGIMKRASDLGMLLFAQPANFEWLWEASEHTQFTRTTTQRQAVILPGLLKVTDQNAIPLSSPIRLVEPQTAMLNTQ